MGKGWGRRRVLIAAVVAALVVIPAVLVLTQQRAASAATILSILDGTASVARGTAAFVVASDGDVLNTGDRVQTADRSHALVTFFDGSTLEIEPATTVQIEAAADAGGAIDIRIAQTLGRTWSSVQKLTRADSRFEIRTPTVTAAVRGTGFVTEVLADGTSTVQTSDGTVLVTAQGQTVSVTAGQTTTAQPGAPPSAPAPIVQAPNRLRFGLHSPAYLAVIDPFGRSCGVVLPGPTMVRQIPGCLASDPGSDPQLVDIPNAAPGSYRVVITTIAPGGAFVVTASALDGLGALSFSYTASGSGEPGAKFGTGIDVSTTASGALTASGLLPLAPLDASPVKAANRKVSPRPTVSGTPDTALFAPLPSTGSGAGTNSTRSPVAAGTPSPSPSQTSTPTVTSAAPTTSPTSAPTEFTPAPQTPVPTQRPTPQPTVPPTPTPTLSPTPTPTPQPTPTPFPPTLSGGSASAGATLAVLGTNWTVGATITITWPDGSRVGGADVQPDGRFATLIRVPQNAVPGQTYRITASGGGLTATADVTIAIVYTPSFTLLNSFPPRAGGSVSYVGRGWPENRPYSIAFDGVALSGTATGGTTSTAGDFQGSFVVPPNTAPGQHTVTATSAGYSVNAPLLTQ